MYIIYVMYVFFRVFSIGCSTTYSWYLGILKIKVGVGWWLWKSIDRYLPMFFQFNPAIHGHRVTNLPSPKTLQQWVYESIHVWIVLYARITYTNIVQRYVLFLAKKRTIFSKLPVLDTHTQKHTRRFPFQVRRLEMRVQPIGLHIETALVSEVWSGLGDLFVGFVKLSFVRFVGGMVV